MDPILAMFLNWQFIVFSLAIAAIIFVLRTIVDYFVTKEKLKKFWQGVLLPILPVIVGGVAALIIKAYPYPNDLDSTGSRILFGVVSGLFSGLFYRVIKTLIGIKAPVTSEVTSETTSEEETK